MLKHIIRIKTSDLFDIHTKSAQELNVAISTQKGSINKIIFDIKKDIRHIISNVNRN